MWVFCLEGFVRGGFCPPPLLSEYIRYNRKLNITFNFRFHTDYVKFEKCDLDIERPLVLKRVKHSVFTFRLVSRT